MKFHSHYTYIIQEHSIKIQILRYHFGISFKNIIFKQPVTDSYWKHNLIESYSVFY